MKPLKFPLITITCAFAAGIIAQYYWKIPFSILLISSLFGALLFGFFYWKSNKRIIQNATFGIVVYLLSFVLGMITFFVHLDSNKQNHYSRQTFEATNSIRGVVQTPLKPNAKYNKYFVTVTSFNQANVSGKLLIYVPKKTKIILHSGAEIWFMAPVYSIPKAYNPYQFDYANYLEKQNVFHQVYANENYLKVIQQHHDVDYFLENLRNSLSRSFDIHHFDAKTKAIVDALLLGQRVEMDTQTVTDYSNAGVIHVLAISGLHISILYFVLVFLLKPLKRVKFGNEIQLVIILSFLWLFALLTGLPASVTRAVTLFSFISIGNYFNQPKAIYNAMAISAFLILLFVPNAIFDIGFQLSYAAVLAIILFQPFYKKFHFTKNKIGIYFIDTILVSIAAQIGVLPLSLYYFNQLPMLFLLANLVVIPLSSFVLIYGILILVLNFIFPEAAVFLGKLLSFLIQLMNDYIHWIAQFKSGIITNISFSAIMVLTLYLFIISCLFWIYKKKRKHIVYVLVALFIFQISFIFVKIAENKGSELIVFNDKSSLIGIKNRNTIIAFTDAPENHIATLNHYSRGTFSDSLRIFPMQNVLSFDEKRILIIDSLGIYKTSIKPEIVVLMQSPKINLSRLIKDVNPKLIIADKTNYRNLLKVWSATCQKEKIPFHAIAEKGFYRLK